MSDILRDFDKKNEIPKVKIPKFSTGGICNGAIFAFSQIDEIVKGIRERQDNAMAMEFTKRIGELLKRNGVVPKITEYTRDFETDNTFETRYGVSIDELDFSEHDKVFEDKIAKLERQIRIYESKIQELRTRCMESARDNFDNGIYGCLTIVKYPNELEAENRELKQRIAELENENKNLNIRIFLNEAYGDKKPTKINLNDRVKVKLTPLGAEIYYHQFDDVDKKIKKNGGTGFEPMMPQIDKDGYTEIQLWHFIELYGEHIGVCKPNVIKPLDIVIAE